MATSAFKSTTRRGSDGGGSETSVDKGQIRRSRSVSALPRVFLRPLDVTCDFLNKRDNPLFRSSGCPPDEEAETVGIPDNRNKKVAADRSSVDGERERGRSVARNPRFINKEEAPTGKRMEVSCRGARIDKRRKGRRSLSTGGHHVVSESEADRESVVSFNYERNNSWNAAGNNSKEANSGQEVVDMQTQYTEYRGIGSLNSNFASNMQTPNMEDWDSTRSFLGAEEKIIKGTGEQLKGIQMAEGKTAASGIYETVRCEVRRAILDIQNDLAIQKNNAAAITVTNFADVPPDLVNPGALGLVLDTRREYAIKLEESQERARKLRADLAVEEHKGQELNRILEELLPDPKTNNLQITKLQKKKSSERKKMTKRLTEEALAYFDECVSISTFDSSDFSAAEDQPLILNRATTPVGRSPFSVQRSLSISGSCCSGSYLDHKQESGGLLVHSQMSSSLTAGSSSDEPLIDKASLKGSNRGRKLQFSFSSEPTKNVGLQEDIKSYTKNVKKPNSKNNTSPDDIRTSCNDIGEYRLRCSEIMLYDRILYKNRTDSGTLHLCDGGGWLFRVLL